MAGRSKSEIEADDRSCRMQIVKLQKDLAEMEGRRTQLEQEMASSEARLAELEREMQSAG